MKRKILYIIVLIVISFIVYKLSYCNYSPASPTKFYLIYTNQNTRTKYEVFVVSNAPCNTNLLKEVVEQFNFETWPIDTLRKYKALERIFYKETKYMTKDFREGDEYNPVFDNWNNIKDFRNHANDVLIQSRYYLDGINGKKYYSIWIKGNRGYNHNYQHIDTIKETFYNLDSFYFKRKEIYRIK